MTTSRGVRRAIKAVLFDLDDTLMAHTTAVGAAIDVMRARAAEPGRWHAPALAAADPETVRVRWHELEDEHYHRYLYGELDYLGQRVARARGLYTEHGVELDVATALEWFEAYLVGYREAWALFDDVLPALDALRVLPVRFGVITNGDLGFQTDKLHRIELWNRLDLTPVRADSSIDEPSRRGRLMASGELGVTKPDARIFHAAAAAFGLPASACCYVGDRVRTDAVGAHDAGMLGIWLDRGSDRNPVTDLAEGDVPGVPSIPSLLALPALLAV